MSYRLSILSKIYPAILAQAHYSEHTTLEDKSYQEQTLSLAHCFSGIHGVFEPLSQLGNEVQLTFSGTPQLIDSWNRENGSQLNDEEILFSRVEAFKPDVLFLIDAFGFSENDFIERIKQRIPSIKRVCGIWGLPTLTPNQKPLIEEIDAFFSCIPQSFESFKEHPGKFHYLPHAFNQNLLKSNENTATRPIDFIFAGALSPAHKIRHSVISNLAKSEQINLQLHTPSGLDKTIETTIKRNLLSLREVLPIDRIMPRALSKKMDSWQQFFDAYDLAPHIRRRKAPPLYGKDMLSALAQSKIGFNNHIDGTPYAANLRLYEVTAMGSVLLTDWKPNLKDLFEEDVEVVSYKSAEECIEKARWLLDNDGARQAIAKAGRARTLSSHTFEDRANRFHEVITTYL